MAVKNRKVDHGLILNSDRRVRYASKKFIMILEFYSVKRRKAEKIVVCIMQ
ncbi:protein of unknown function [Chryseobacterium sp. JV274]|nr:protein of unknown function [Chryseobacterium sp. JV274]